MERLRYNCLRPPCNLGSLGVLQFADGREVNVTAHVIREGTLVEEGEREVRQQMDVETEKIVFLDKAVEVVSGLRVSLYGKRSEDHDQPVRMFRYGERLRFPVKLHPPRNFRNPGALDHQQYLADQGIVALGSVKTERVELLTGVFGNRAELWRTRVHRSIIEKVRSLWSPAQAGLVDAMVIGEDAFISRDLRVDFQRSGTYHVLVVSGMNVGILAFVTCWVLRRLRVSDLVASAITVVLAVAYALRSDLASHSDAGPVSRGTIALSREVHAQRDWSGGVGLADRESASSVWAEFSTDFFVRAVDRGGRRTHPRAYFATLPPRFDVSGFDALRPVVDSESGTVQTRLAHGCGPPRTLHWSAPSFARDGGHASHRICGL